MAGAQAGRAAGTRDAGTRGAGGCTGTACAATVASMSFTDTPVLENADVRLEPLSTAHHDELVRAATPGELWRAWYTSIPSPTQMSDEIARRLALRDSGSMAPWAIIDPTTGSAIGMTSYLNIDAPNRHVEIGTTWMALSAQGTRINPAAKRLLLSRAFDDLDCIAVEFRTNWHNHQSRAAIAKLGAKQDGVLRNHTVTPEGVLRDTVTFSIIASEWPTVRTALDYRLRKSA